MSSNWYKIILRLFKVKYGNNLLLKGIPVIFNKKNAKIQIGENVTIKSSFLSNLVGLYQRTIIVTRVPKAEIIIGDNVGISGATIYARKRIVIGDRTCIGGNTKILDNDFHPIDKIQRTELNNSNAPEEGDKVDWIGTKEVVIGSDCFIGCNVIILKGTVLGSGCVVGAGAVVSGIFDDNVIIAGNPARVVKKLI